MQGETVIVRAFKGRPLVRRVWDATREVVYICSEETFNKLVAGDDERSPIGFPRADVFIYDSEVADALMSNWRDDASLWERLTVWREAPEVGRSVDSVQ